MRGEPSTLPEGAPLRPGYEVVEHIRRGSEVDTYDAWSEERSCRCVVKVLRPDHEGDTGARRRLVAEGALLRRIAHPHVVRLLEAIGGDRPALVMDTLSGETLGHMIESRARRLPVLDLAFLGLHLTSALGYMHRRGVLHLDVKPSNVVCQAGRAILLDLGLARAPGRGRRGVGTAAYLAPEQARGETLGPATDTWGLGATLFHAASGERPFPTSADGTYAQLAGRAPSLRSARRGCGDLADLVDACLDPLPERRPTLEDVGFALDRILRRRGA